MPLAFECRQPGLAALTFDDGPSSHFATVLDTLNTHAAPATFFVLGEHLENPTKVELLNQAVMAGHQIENHGWNHARFSTLTNAELVEQVVSTAAIILDRLGIGTRFVRPPHGDIQIEQGIPIWDLGYGIALWNGDPADYSQRPPDAIVRDIDAAVGQSDATTDSFIVLLHDSSPTSATKLGEIITIFRSHGYTLVTYDNCVDAGVE